MMGAGLAITLESHVLTLATELLGIRLSKSFLLADALQLRLSERPYTSRGRRRLSRKIAFDHHGRQVEIRGNLSREEGEALYGILAPYFVDCQPLAPRKTDEPADEVPE